MSVTEWNCVFGEQIAGNKLFMKHYQMSRRKRYDISQFRWLKMMMTSFIWGIVSKVTPRRVRVGVRDYGSRVGGREIMDT